MAEQGTEVSLLGKIAGYTEILSKDPRSTVFVPLSEAYRKMKMLDDAIEVASKGVAALPHYAPGFIALARAQAERGLVSEAAQAFEIVLKLEDENLQGLKGLARVRMMQGRIDDAQGILIKAKSLAPDDPQINSMLGSFNQGVAGAKTTPAVDAANPAPEPEAPIATATLAEIYVRQGLLRKAYNIYRELHLGDPQNGALQSRMNEIKQLLDYEQGQTTPHPQGGATKEALSAPGAAVATTAILSPTAAILPPPAAGAAAEMTGDVQARLSHWLVSIRRRRQNVR